MNMNINQQLQQQHSSRAQVPTPPPPPPPPVPFHDAQFLPVTWTANTAVDSNTTATNLFFGANNNNNHNSNNAIVEEATIKPGLLGILPTEQQHQQQVTTITGNNNHHHTTSKQRERSRSISGGSTGIRTDAIHKRHYHYHPHPSYYFPATTAAPARNIMIVPTITTTNHQHHHHHLHHDFSSSSWPPHAGTNDGMNNNNNRENPCTDNGDVDATTTTTTAAMDVIHQDDNVPAAAPATDDKATTTTTITSTTRISTDFSYLFGMAKQQAKRLAEQWYQQEQQQQQQQRQEEQQQQQQQQSPPLLLPLPNHHHPQDIAAADERRVLTTPSSGRGRGRRPSQRAVAAAKAAAFQQKKKTNNTRRRRLPNNNKKKMTMILQMQVLSLGSHEHHSEKETLSLPLGSVSPPPLPMMGAMRGKILSTAEPQPQFETHPRSTLTSKISSTSSSFTTRSDAAASQFLHAYFGTLWTVLQSCCLSSAAAAAAIQPSSSSSPSVLPVLLRRVDVLHQVDAWMDELMAVLQPQKQQQQQPQQQRRRSSLARTMAGKIAPLNHHDQSLQIELQFVKLIVKSPQSLSGNETETASLTDCQSSSNHNNNNSAAVACHRHWVVFWLTQQMWQQYCELLRRQQQQQQQQHYQSLALTNTAMLPQPQIGLSMSVGGNAPNGGLGNVSSTVAAASQSTTASTAEAAAAAAAATTDDRTTIALPGPRTVTPLDENNNFNHGLDTVNNNGSGFSIVPPLSVKDAMALAMAPSRFQQQGLEGHRHDSSAATGLLQTHPSPLLWQTCNRPTVQQRQQQQVPPSFWPQEERAWDRANDSAKLTKIRGRTVQASSADYGMANSANPMSVFHSETRSPNVDWTSNATLAVDRGSNQIVPHQAKRSLDRRGEALAATNQKLIKRLTEQQQQQQQQTTGNRALDKPSSQIPGNLDNVSGEDDSLMSTSDALMLAELLLSPQHSSNTDM